MAEAGVGRPAKINLELILETARRLERSSLTITAVAEELGVVRNAVSYYVNGRAELISLVAARDLADRLEDLDVPDDDWRAAIRTVGRGMFEALADETALDLLSSGVPGYPALRPAELLLTALLNDGFDEEAASWALRMLTEIVFAAARLRLARATENARPPAEAELGRLLREAPDDFPALQRVAPALRSGPTTPDRDIDLLLLGLEGLRRGRG